MNKTATGIYDFSIGKLLIRESEGRVSEIRLLEKQCETEHAPSSLTDLAAREISEYLAGERKNFTVPVSFCGTDFQKRIWSAIAEIPCGETVIYSELAAIAGNPAAVRATASACGKNPIMIVIPCHRVVGKNNLGGFAYGTALKEYLLNLEREKYKRYANAVIRSDLPLRR